MDFAVKIFRPIRRILIAVLVIYVGTTVLMMFLERSMVYPVPPRSSGDWNPDRIEYEEVDFRSADGTRLHGWFLEHPDPVATLLMCHGNGEHVAFLAEEMAFLSARLKINVMVFDYRGYGKSKGKPLESGVLADAEAAQRWLAERTGQALDDLILFGRSLGGAVCVHLRPGRTGPPSRARRLTENHVPESNHVATTPVYNRVWRVVCCDTFIKNDHSPMRTQYPMRSKSVDESG